MEIACTGESNKRKIFTQPPHKPWLTPYLLNRITVKNRLYKKTTKQPYNENLLNYYKRYRDKLKKEIQESKNKYFRETLNNLRGNSKETWKVVNTLLGENNRREPVKKMRATNGETLLNENLIANELNNHFISIYSAKNTKKLNINDYNSYKMLFDKPIHHYHSMFFTPITNLEIEGIVLSMKSRKSPGYDNIRIELIKNVIKSISSTLAHIYNLSLETGVYPKKLKNAIVVPIFKSGDKENPNNYRPIALLSVFAKILEKVVRIRLVSFLTKHSFFSKNQFGFQKGLSTEDAMLKFISEIYNGINNNKKCAGLYLDIRKAYDTVNHDILLGKLQDSGVRGVCNNWFKSFLSNRSQQVRIGDSLSELKLIDTGVGLPQGSGLSAELFLVYVNDLCNGNFEGSVTAFADDTALSYSADDRGQLAQMISEDLKKLNLWLQVNALELNASKSHIIVHKLRPEGNDLMNISFHSNECDSPINCTCEKISEAPQVKYLGIIIDSKLTWNQQIIKLKRELTCVCRKFYYIRNLCPEYVMESLYYALVNSRLQYGIAVWGGAYFNNIKPLVTGQKYILRTIDKKPRLFSSLPIFRKWGFLPLRYLYFFKVLSIFFFRSGQVNVANREYYLRSASNLTRPRPHKEIFKRFYLFIAPKVYNEIPISIRQQKNPRSFKFFLKNWLLEKQDVEVWFRDLR